MVGPTRREERAWKPTPQSSWIHSYRYMPDKKEIQVRYKNKHGMVTGQSVYDNIPKRLNTYFGQVKSKGKFWWKYLGGPLRHERSGTPLKYQKEWPEDWDFEAEYHKTKDPHVLGMYADALEDHGYMQHAWSIRNVVLPLIRLAVEGKQHRYGSEYAVARAKKALAIVEKVGVNRFASVVGRHSKAQKKALLRNHSDKRVLNHNYEDAERQKLLAADIKAARVLARRTREKDPNNLSDFATASFYDSLPSDMQNQDREYALSALGFDVRQAQTEIHNGKKTDSLLGWIQPDNPFKMSRRKVGK